MATTTADTDGHDDRSVPLPMELPVIMIVIIGPAQHSGEREPQNSSCRQVQGLQYRLPKIFRRTAPVSDQIEFELAVYQNVNFN